MYSSPMNIWGHIAVGSLIDQTFTKRIHTRLVLLCVGALLPDIIDKPLMLLKVYPWGRTLGHSVFVWSAFHLFAAYQHRHANTSNKPLLWISFGWFSHFLADLTDDFVQGLTCTSYLFTGWMGWPITNPDMLAVIFGTRAPECQTGYELAIVGIAILYTFSRHRRRGSRHHDE